MRRLTATRSDPLAAGGSYPTLTVTVNVAANAAASVTDTATVSGGGETNTANDTASNMAAIAQLPDLTVTSTHSGTFQQGDSGDSYTITVSNAGTGPTSGTVSLVDTLPAGLTATAMSGSGWTFNISTLTATRSDPLAAGGSYPAITLDGQRGGQRANQPDQYGDGLRRWRGGHRQRHRHGCDQHPQHVGTALDLERHPVAQRRRAGGGRHQDPDDQLQRDRGRRRHGGELPAAIRRSRRDVGHGRRRSVPLSASYSGATATLSFAALTTGVYRLTVFDTITDTSGNKLDGNGDGLPGGNFVRDFVVVPAASNPLFGTAATFSSGGGGPMLHGGGRFQRRRQTGPGRRGQRQQHGQHLLATRSAASPPPVTYSTGGSDSLGIAAGDFNGDGKLDLAIANYDSNTVGVLLGNGNGTFAAPVTYSSGGSNPYAIAVADFNGDGKQDIAVTNDWSNSVGVLMGSGNGTFAAPATYGVIGSFPDCRCRGRLQRRRPSRPGRGGELGQRQRVR